TPMCDLISSSGESFELLQQRVGGFFSIDIKVGRWKDTKPCLQCSASHPNALTCTCNISISAYSRTSLFFRLRRDIRIRDRSVLASLLIPVCRRRLSEYGSDVVDLSSLALSDHAPSLPLASGAVAQRYRRRLGWRKCVQL